MSHDTWAVLPQLKLIYIGLFYYDDIVMEYFHTTIYYILTLCFYCIIFIYLCQPTQKHHAVIEDAHFYLCISIFVYPYLWNNMHSWTLGIRRLGMCYDSGADNYIKKSTVISILFIFNCRRKIYSWSWKLARTISAFKIHMKIILLDNFHSISISLSYVCHYKKLLPLLRFPTTNFCHFKLLSNTQFQNIVAQTSLLISSDM